MSFNKTNRQIHKWGSIVIALPFLIVLVTGILLLLKKELGFIQPPTAIGTTQVPTLAFEHILDISKSVKIAEINTWQDVDRLDVRPDKGLVKVRSNNSIEIQIDTSSGEVLHVAKRNSDFIESIHDGTFFEKNANLWLMLPMAITMLALVITGLVLFFSPYIRNRKKRMTR